MIGIKNRARRNNVFFQTAGLFPRQRKNPLKIVTNNGCFGAHRPHIAQFFQFCCGFFTNWLWQFHIIQLSFDFIKLIHAILAFTKLFLDGLHLLVQIIFALGFFHLPLDAVTHSFFDLKRANFAFHHAQNLFKTLMHIKRFKQILLFGDFHGQMRGNHIGNFISLIDLLNRT